MAWRSQPAGSGRIASFSTHGTGGALVLQTHYAHDGHGQRVLKRHDPAPTPPPAACAPLPRCPRPASAAVVSIHDLDGQLLGEYPVAPPSGAAQPPREIVWVQGKPLVLLDGPAASTDIHYVHTDHLNTPRVVQDRWGRQRWSWLSEPFGDTEPDGNPQGVGAFTLNLRMPGQVFDEESGLLYNWHRSYDPGVGRYTQSDPIGLAGGINTYAYASGNPVSNTDPLGLWSITIEGYAGLGGGVTIGRDPNTGQPFMNARVGFGLGGGFKWDKNGGRPGSDGLTNACKGNGAGLGVFADLDLNAGPLQAGLQNSWGRNSGTGGYGQFMSPSWALGDSWGIKAGGSFGGQITIWTPDVRPRP